MDQVIVNKIYAYCCFALLIILAGCVSMRPKMDFPSQDLEYPSIALTDIDKVEPGMTFIEVAGIMGDAVLVGYKKSPDQTGTYEKILVKNPYDEILIEDDEAVYKILYYLTHIRKADGIVTEDELTPLVFKEEILVSKEWKFLQKLKDR